MKFSKRHAVLVTALLAVCSSAYANQANQLIQEKLSAVFGQAPTITSMMGSTTGQTSGSFTTDSTGSNTYGSSLSGDIQQFKTNIDQIRADMLAIAGQKTSGGQIDSAGLVMPAAGGIFSSSASSSVTIPPVIEYVNTGGSGGGSTASVAAQWIPTAGKTAISQGITATGADLRCANSSTDPTTGTCSLYITIQGSYYTVGYATISASSLSAGTYNPAGDNYIMPASYMNQVSWSASGAQGQQYYNSRGTALIGGYTEANVTPNGLSTVQHVIHQYDHDQTIGSITNDSVGWR